MQHELVHSVDNFDPETDDDDDSYSFIYELENSDHYKIRFEDKVIEGKQLFRHIRMAQYGQLMATIVDELWCNEAFADFPKLLPFRFLVDDSESSYQSDGTLETFYEFRSPITEESLDGHPLEAQHRASAEPPEPLTPEQQWLYLMAFLADGDAPERTALVDLLAREATLLEHTLVLAGESLSRATGLASENTPAAGSDTDALRQARQSGAARAHPVAYAALFWSLGEGHRDTAQAFARRLMSSPLPALPRGDIEAAIAASTNRENPRVVRRHPLHLHRRDAEAL